MPTPASQTLELRPPSGHRVGGKPAFDAVERQAVPANRLLRQSAEEHDGSIGRAALPYLLRDWELSRVDKVWNSDISYVQMRYGFMYLRAMIISSSRYVLSWRMSNTLEGRFCLEVLDEALRRGRPEVFQHRPGFAVHGARLHRPPGGGQDRGEP